MDSHDNSNNEQSGSIAEDDFAAAGAATASGAGARMSKPLLTSSTSLGASSTTSSQRTFNFTEAVPLSLSSMAHCSVPLQEGVLDGIAQVLGHTMLSCVNYARIMHPPHDWTFADLCTSNFAWMPVKQEKAEESLPFSLVKLKFCHFYTKTAYLYLRPALFPTASQNWTCPEDEFQHVTSYWPQRLGVLACIKLLYASTEPLTRDELNGIGDAEDIPPTILYKVVVEYRSLPATGNLQAVAAEELSMLSFGGSIDDTVKYGALASLYDATAPYVLEIYSVRGKKYKFDLMDATLSNGTIPRLASLPAASSSTSTSSGGGGGPQEKDPFVKSLCVTVTNHNTEPDVQQQQQQGGATDGNKKKHYAITRMHLTLDGKLRGGGSGAGGSDAAGGALQHLPMINFVSNRISAAFRALDPRGSYGIATATPSGHVLLLDPQQAGRIYINGRFITTWGDSMNNDEGGIGGGRTDASHGVALFGMDLHSVPVWLNRIVDYQAMRRAYGQLWQDVLIDANLLPLQIASKLLHRLLSGKDKSSNNNSSSRDGDDDDNDDDDGYDDDSTTVAAVANIDCLESQVLSSPEYDMVGIAAKALATRFAMEFGKFAFPCQAHEVEFVRTNLPSRRPIVVVPQRLICILRRGGYFDAQRTLDDLWFDENTMIPLDRIMSTTDNGDNSATELVKAALELLDAAGCDEISPQQIGFVLDAGEGTVYPGCIASRGKDKNVVIAEKVVCRYKEVSQQYCIHADFLKANVMEYTDTPGDEGLTNKVRAYLLGMYLAQAHPDGTMLTRYLLRNKAPTGITAASPSPSSPTAITSPKSPPESGHIEI